MGEEPSVIREQIDQTRERMGETVDALGYKADVPARARESISGRVDTLKSKISGVGSSVSSTTPDADAVKQSAGRAVGVVQENPLGLAIGAAAVGFLAGMLAPSTRIEDERLGPVADQIKEQAKATGQEALEHGRQVAQETASVAADKAQEAAAEVKDEAQRSAQEHGQQVTESAKESAEQVQQTASAQG
jgi:gas vesicle protein